MAIFPSWACDPSIGAFVAAYVFVHEWAPTGYGVFDEYGSLEDNTYPITYYHKRRSPSKPENIIATTSIIIIITIARVPAKTFSGMLELHGTGPTAQNLAHSTPPKYENMDRHSITAAEPLKLSPAAPLTGVPDPPPAPPAVLPGFAVHDSWSAIQNSLYVILHHGPYQGGPYVDHWCSPPDYLAALSAAQWKNRSIPLQEDASFSKCTMYDPPFMEGKRNGSTVVSCDRWDYDIVDRRDSIVSRFNLVCDRQYLYGLSFVAAILANAVFSPLAGFVSDRFGRKPVIIVCSFTWLIAAIGNSVAETYAMFVTTRVLAYTACNSTFTLIFILLYEVTGNASRWLFTILDTAVAGTFGPPFVHVMSGLEPRWELSQGVLLVPTVLTVLWCCLLSESPAWLLVRWDLQRAQAGALEAALVNGVSLPKAKATFLAIANQMQKIALSQTSTTGSSLAQERTFKLNTTQRKAAAAFFTRFTLNAIYFGMVATEELSGMSWQLVDVFATTAYYGAICVAVNKYGPKNAALIALGVVFMLAASKTLAIVLGSQECAVHPAGRYEDCRVCGGERCSVLYGRNLPYGWAQRRHQHGSLLWLLRNTVRHFCEDA
ncbi:hypothetical protein HPB48_021615 [Haemaphysalis longicornis]|uniref:Uncharacterized protein n=1 Tax=Haemaphysalis longicornis TaxID=44386 RepID=A0A9J6G093_HAELO|nr:hypothetical protein HPB48_021615 [Haemaphysalis longicornis]